MSDSLYSPGRAITFRVAASRSLTDETFTLIVWAVVALTLVLVTIALGGCS